MKTRFNPFSLALGLLFTALMTPAVLAQSDDMGMMADYLHVAEHDTLGAYLVDSHGRTLYLVVDGEETVPCDGDCAAAWPPYTLESMDTMMGESDEMGDDSMSEDAEDMDEMMVGVDTDLIGTVSRDDGTTQITYNGYPLYYFVGDEAPGEVNCQAIEQFGGVWYVLSPTGDSVTTPLN